MSIFSGPARVVEHGMVTAFAAHPLWFGVGSLTLEIHFETDTAERDVAVRNVATETGVALTLVNFDQPDGRGSATPVFLGEDAGELVFFHFRVFRFGKTEDRTVHYTFYRLAPAAG